MKNIMMVRGWKGFPPEMLIKKVNKKIAKMNLEAVDIDIRDGFIYRYATVTMRVPYDNSFASRLSRGEWAEPLNMIANHGPLQKATLLALHKELSKGKPPRGVVDVWNDVAKLHGLGEEYKL